MKKVYLDIKNKKGITLIALVITIIVLLILAGVAVSSITGNDDIMDKAQNAKVATDNANEEEEIKMAAVTAMADNMEGLGVLTADKLKKALNNKYPVADEGDKIKVFAKSTYTLDKSGSVTNDGETPKGEFSITSFSYTPSTISIGGTSSAPSVVVSGIPYQGPKYTSSDTNKATVNETTGLVTGVASGDVTITVTYKNYQNVEVTETATITIQSQNPYSINQVWNFNYTGNVQSFDAYPGTYKLEAYGAEGGTCTANNSSGNRGGGYGGYSYGTLVIQNNCKKLYLYIGGKGENDKTINSSEASAGGWNGGGGGMASGGAGGGATDIALYGTNGSTNWNNANHLYSRIIVAGGGGAGYWNSSGGAGGGTTGGLPNPTRNVDYAASQTSFGYSSESTTSNSGVTIAGFGFGATALDSNNSHDVGGGGGGWYGGGCVGNTTESGGGGGSGYVYTSSTASNYPSGCLLDSSYYLTNAATSTSSHTGNGSAKITLISK